jgi:Ser/Thr protein kinase RdoA (MazF antagonist)
MVVSNVFPVLYSTLSSEALVTRVLPKYDIGRVKSCQFWNRGLSDIYLVETQASRYVLRVSHSHWRSKSDIEFELEFLDFLQKRLIPVAYPLRTKSGQRSISIQAPEGIRYAALFIYAPGEIALGDLNTNQSAKLGETLARIHEAGTVFYSSQARQPLTLDYLLDQSLQEIQPFLSKKSVELHYISQSIIQLKQQLQELPQTAPLWTVCWGDPHSGNAHFTPDNRVTLFDFDQCGYGWRAFDVAKFWQVAIRTGMNKRVREAFLAGYNTVQRLTEEENQLLQALTQVAHIWMWAIGLKASMLHQYSRLDDYYFTSRLEQLKRLSTPEWQLF